MGPTQKLLWKLYVGVIGAVTTVVAQRLVKAAWKLVTGNEPPSPTDPETPVLEAASWARSEAFSAIRSSFVRDSTAGRETDGT